jgi:outer membrane protein
MRLFFIFILMVNSCLIGLGQTNKWNLNKCFNYVEKSNIDIKRAELKIINSGYELNQNKQNKYPNAIFSSNITDQSGRSLDYTTYNYTIQQLLAQNYQVSGSATIFSFGKNKNIEKSKELSLQSANIDFLKTIDEVKFKVLDAYLQVLNSMEQVKLFEIDLSQTRHQVEVVKEQYLAGSNSELNFLQMRNKLISDSTNLLGYSEAYINNVLNLKMLLNINDTLQIEFEDINNELTSQKTILDITPENVYTSALSKFKQHKADLLNIETAKNNIKIALSTQYPTIGFSYNFATAYSEYLSFFDFNKWGKNYGKLLNENFNQQFSIGINIPIYNNSKAKSQYKQSQLGLKDAELQLERNNLELKRKIYSIFSSSVVSLKKLNTSKRLIDGLKEVYEIAKSGYESGGVTSTDLINNQNALLKAQIELLNIQFNYFTNLKILEFYSSGNLKY